MSLSGIFEIYNWIIGQVFLLIETAYRLDENDPDVGLPTIPTHPIGYGIAQKILRYLIMFDRFH